MRKKVICLILAFAILFSSFSVVSADTGAGLDKLVNIAKQIISQFRDVKDSDWYAEAVGKLTSLKILDGFSDGSFRPNGDVTRAEFVKMLVTAMGYKQVTDVSYDDMKTHWANKYIGAAGVNGVIDRSRIGSNFRPDERLNRVDMAEMMVNALKLQPNGGKNPFVDIENNVYINTAFYEYLIRGYVENGVRYYKPKNSTTRAEAVTIITRMLEYKDNPAAYKAKMAAAEQGAAQPAKDTIIGDTFKYENGRLYYKVAKDEVSTFPDGWIDSAGYYDVTKHFTKIMGHDEVMWYFHAIYDWAQDHNLNFVLRSDSDGFIDYYVTPNDENHKVKNISDETWFKCNLVLDPKRIKGRNIGLRFENVSDNPDNGFVISIVGDYLSITKKLMQKFAGDVYKESQYAQFADIARKKAASSYKTDYYGSTSWAEQKVGQYAYCLSADPGCAAEVDYFVK